MSRFCRFSPEDEFDGKVAGLYSPLQIEKKKDSVVLRGETFSYTFSKTTGQIISAKVLDTEFLAPGSQLPNPYIGLFPEADPGAALIGDPRKSIYGWEKAARIKPAMYSSELTNSFVRCDAERSTKVRLWIEKQTASFVHIQASGAYAFGQRECGVRWQVDYEIDVDGFTKIQVQALPEFPVWIQWHCHLHTRLSKDACKYLIPWSDISKAGVIDSGILSPMPLDDEKRGLVYGASLCPYFHLGNVRTGIDFTKERFDGRLAGYRDSGINFPDGFGNAFDKAMTADGAWIDAADSRGLRENMTQILLNDNDIEIEDFDIRNTSCVFNPGDLRSQYFFLQLSPPKLPRTDLNSIRVVWPGPHQVTMAGWAGNKEWHPPSASEVRSWQEAGANLVVGGLHFFDGDAPSATMQDEVRQFIREVHDAGLKVIPYMTFNDFAFGAGEYRRSAPDWYFSSCIEYRNETMLMCYNADGWRDNFERQAEWILSNFDFDGLYIDHWGTRKCDNSRHGCGTPPFMWVTEAYHDIAKRARRVVARHTNGKGIMLLNSGGDPFTACAGMFDMRLQGENIDLKRVPEKDLALSMNPERQGAHAVVYPGHWKLSSSFVCFVAASGFGYRIAEALRDSGKASSMLLTLSRIERDFGCDNAKKISTFGKTGILKCGTTDLHVNAFCTSQGALLVGGRLPASDVAEIDRAALSESIRASLSKAGIREHVVGRVVSSLEPFYLPPGAEATVDQLETAVKRAGKSEMALTQNRDPQTNQITIQNRRELFLPEGPLAVKDLFGNAKPDLHGNILSLTTHHDEPFVLFLTWSQT